MTEQTPASVHHAMLPGTHEWPRTPECRCGAEWDWHSDRCASGAKNPPCPETLYRLVDASGDVVSESWQVTDYFAYRDQAEAAAVDLSREHGPLTIEQTTFIPRWTR